MMTIEKGLLEAFSHPEFTTTLGWTFALAMMVGAILNDGGRKLISWTIAIITSTALTEVARWYYWLAHGMPDLSIQGSAITLICVTINVIGLGAGWFIAYSARCKARGKPIFPIREEHMRRKTDNLLERG